jgi:arylsulfatase A-like enzyme
LREALRFLEQNKNRPFFLYLPFNAPHGASNLDPEIRGAAQAPEKWRKMYPELYSREGFVEGVRYNKPAMVPNNHLKKSQYKGSVTAMDSAIGQVLDRLDEYQLTEKTIVIFFSDNGGSGHADNSPLRGGKSTNFEGGIRVCCLIRYPLEIPKGKVSGEFLTSLEIVPTLLSLTGLDRPGEIVLDGFDMMPILASKQSSKRTEMYWKRQGDEAARVDDWKWIRQDQEVFLFDLKSDIGEKNNLAERMPEKVLEIQAKFENWLKEMTASEPRRPFRDF